VDGTDVSDVSRTPEGPEVHILDFLTRPGRIRLALSDSYAFGGNVAAIAVEPPAGSAS